MHTRDRVSQSGFTLLELVITLTVMSVVVLATILIAQNGRKRQKEMRLRETLQIRSAIRRIPSATPSEPARKARPRLPTRRRP
ncbi:MAG: type II secretion system protein [Acidobacteria bacterium]|nr:type II secretion system protein [Acidobacteriota bacterium]